MLFLYGSVLGDMNVFNPHSNLKTIELYGCIERYTYQRLSRKI